MHGNGPECCRNCQTARGESTQCSACDRPDIYPENREAVQVFWQASTQWRVSMAGITGLDYLALDKVMDFMGVTDKKNCFEKIRILESEQLKIIHGKED